MKRWMRSAGILGYTPSDIAVLVAVFGALSLVLIIAQHLPLDTARALLYFVGFRQAQ